MFLIKGNSGCDITLLETHKYPVVKKSCSKNYASRLKKQSKKQKEFSDFLIKKNQTNITTPKVLDNHFENDENYFVMEFFNGLDPMTFFENSGKSSLKKFIEKIFDLLEIEILACQEKDITDEVLKKTKDTIANVRKNKFSKLTKKEVNDCEEVILKTCANRIVVPVGMCHGDLTFSNMIIDTHNDKICLIDFLDSFVETPFFDILKLRQDTSFLWTISMHGRIQNLTKIELCCDFLDGEIHRNFVKFDWYANNYRACQILNMLRVDQYTSSDDIGLLVRKAIRKLLYGKNNSDNTGSRQII